ncbi:MAG: hypothetical protein OQJ98_01905 [Candidatus Pacebacteria bacterium]|nr:hypothetical protein [Candidatus Paceibacterota bacterium]
MFDQKQTFNNITFSQEEVLKMLKKHFGVITIKGVFLASYHSQYGPESKSRPHKEVSCCINRELACARRLAQLPYFVMRTYQLIAEEGE